jgi:hypothetical protein
MNSHQSTVLPQHVTYAKHSHHRHKQPAYSWLHGRAITVRPRIGGIGGSGPRSHARPSATRQPVIAFNEARWYREMLSALNRHTHRYVPRVRRHSARRKLEMTGRTAMIGLGPDVFKGCQITPVREKLTLRFSSHSGMRSFSEKKNVAKPQKYK